MASVFIRTAVGHGTDGGKVLFQKGKPLGVRIGLAAGTVGFFAVLEVLLKAGEKVLVKSSGTFVIAVLHLGGCADVIHKGRHSRSLGACVGTAIVKKHAAPRITAAEGVGRDRLRLVFLIGVGIRRCRTFSGGRPLEITHHYGTRSRDATGHSLVGASRDLGALVVERCLLPPLSRLVLDYYVAIVGCAADRPRGCERRVAADDRDVGSETVHPPADVVGSAFIVEMSGLAVAEHRLGQIFTGDDNEASSVKIENIPGWLCGLGRRERLA